MNAFEIVEAAWLDVAEAKGLLVKAQFCEPLNAATLKNVALEAIGRARERLRLAEIALDGEIFTAPNAVNNSPTSLH